MLPIEIAASMVLVIVVPVMLLWFLVTPYWERKYMTDDRKVELKSERAKRRNIKISHRIWGVISDIVVFTLPTLFAIDGLIFNLGILYSPFLSFFNPIDSFLQVVGFAISLVGLTIFVVAGRTLTIHAYAKAANERKMITTGLYAYIRHPLYLSFLLLPLGILLMSLNYLALLLFVALTIFADPNIREGQFTFITTAMDCEEEGLIRIYGNDYKDYMKTTGRLLPRFRKK